MTTATGHTSAIRAKEVIGTNVKDRAGQKIGQIEDIVLTSSPTASSSPSSASAAFWALEKSTTRCLGLRWTMTRRTAAM